MVNSLLALRMRRNAIHKSLPAALSDLDLDQLCRGSRQGSVGEAQGQVITALKSLIVSSE
jgi:hypothetical protein